jgi:hypothetical protein
MSDVKDKGTMLARILFISCWFALISCGDASRKDKEKLCLDEVSLRQFVVATSVDPNQVRCAEVLDSILRSHLADSCIFRQTASFLIKEFSDPNSPYRNEAMCVRLFQSELSSNWFSQIEKEKARSYLQLLHQNTVGSAANDFAYLTPGGNRRRLYEVRSRFCLLFFYNPECEACKDMKAALLLSEIISSKIHDGELKVVAIYIDNDQAVWRKNLAGQPGMWLQGRDENGYLFKHKIYDLKAIPTIYLLDRNKMVLLKDCVSVAAIQDILQKS